MAYLSPFSEPPRILLMENDLTMREHYFGALEWSGYDVDEVSNAGEACEAINASRYDILIGDDNLLHTFDFETLKKLHPVRSAWPIIIATGELNKAKAFSPLPFQTPIATIPNPYSEDNFLETVCDVLNSADRSQHSAISPNVWKV